MPPEVRVPILVKVLMTAACWPLLLPPGYCVCKAAVASHDAAGSQGFAGESASAPLKTGCCYRCHAGGANSASQQSTPRPSPDAPHLPGCPASEGVSYYKWAETTAPLSLGLLPPIGFVDILPLEVAHGFAEDGPSTSNRPSSSPLYLAHCSLVI